ncbi:hypothetical protein DLJ53_28185 [Acuticoccus sediminis]|uniref:Uncharacterized protein n=1 Tax=Acuticoccus sediminis TaxID=2184697 RepID=A0A8B2NMB7_9HYPH|nr:hypothetical protein [Acuticoccus sediminis]RAH97726.1 hypothetical protein DLJ53_28185 [Acuticoccus sediminis]
MTRDYIDRLAAATLVAEADEAGPGNALPVSSIVSGALAADGTGPSVIPIGALPLYRALRASQAVVASPMARAAATGVDQERTVGGVTLRTVHEEDVTWLVIELGDTEVPVTLELVGPEGNVVRLPLDPPIDGVQQVGFSRSTFAGREAIALLENPSTAIFLL